MNRDFDHKHIWIFLLFSCVGQFGYSQEISTNVRVTAGAVNGVFIERNGKTLVVYGDPNDEVKKADMVLFTHFRRDVIGPDETWWQRAPLLWYRLRSGNILQREILFGWKLHVNSFVSIRTGLQKSQCFPSTLIVLSKAEKLFSGRI